MYTAFLIVFFSKSPMKIRTIYYVALMCISRYSLINKRYSSPIMKKLRFAEKTTCKDVKVIDLKVNALSSMMSGH